MVLKWPGRRNASRTTACGGKIERPRGSVYAIHVDGEAKPRRERENCFWAALPTRLKRQQQVSEGRLELHGSERCRGHPSQTTDVHRFPPVSRQSWCCDQRRVVVLVASSHSPPKQRFKDCPAGGLLGPPAAARLAVLERGDLPTPLDESLRHIGPMHNFSLRPARQNAATCGCRRSGLARCRSRPQSSDIPARPLPTSLLD